MPDAFIMRRGGGGGRTLEIPFDDFIVAGQKTAEDGYLWRVPLGALPGSVKKVSGSLAITGGAFLGATAEVYEISSIIGIEADDFGISYLVVTSYNADAAIGTACAGLLNGKIRVELNEPVRQGAIPYDKTRFAGGSCYIPTLINCGASNYYYTIPQISASANLKLSARPDVYIRTNTTTAKISTSTTFDVTASSALSALRKGGAASAAQTLQGICTEHLLKLAGGTNPTVHTAASANVNAGSYYDFIAVSMGNGVVKVQIPWLSLGEESAYAFTASGFAAAVIVHAGGESGAFTPVSAYADGCLFAIEGTIPETTLPKGTAGYLCNKSEKPCTVSWTTKEG